MFLKFLSFFTGPILYGMSLPPAFPADSSCNRDQLRLQCLPARVWSIDLLFRASCKLFSCGLGSSLARASVAKGLARIAPIALLHDTIADM